MARRTRFWAAAAAVCLTALAAAPAPAEAAVPSTFRMVVMGDSIAEGCCETTSTTKFGPVIARSLGYPAPITKAQGGGVGYLTKGTYAGKLSYQNRIGQILGTEVVNPDMFVFSGGNNDRVPKTLDEKAAFRGAVRNTYKIAKTKAPRTRFYVIGQFNPNGTPNAVKEAIIKEEAARAAFPYVSQAGWFTGAREKGWLWRDNFHPNGPGHDALGRKAAAALKLKGVPQ